MKLTHRSQQPELLDGDHLPAEALQRNMQELEIINNLLGGHAITLAGCRQLLGNRTTLRICEIGCGGGDNLAAIIKWCEKNGITVSATGIDIQPAVIAMAARRPALSQTDFIVSDYRTVHFHNPPDIIFSSLFCHHFTNQELIEQFRWMHHNSRVGFFINDLHRHTVAYHAIRVLTRLFSRSYLVKNDAPLSVARGFTRHELQSLLQQVPLPRATIQWRWAFRYLIVCAHD